MFHRLRLGFDSWYVLLLACALPLLFFLLQGRIGFGFSDEGFVWYGVEETVHRGAVPMLDYRAYDPGRYYWSAAWSVVFGSGIIAFRLSQLVMQMFGLAFGLLAARYVLKRWWMLLFAALILIIWMLPRHKYAESGFAMLTVYMAARLILSPTQLRHFLLGVVVGLAAYFGRNLGLYTALGSCVVMLYIQIKVSRLPLRQALLRSAVWAGGVVVGYLPMLMMIALIPEFANAYLESILFWFRVDELNIARPVIWPWMVPLRGNTLTQFAISLVFLFMPLFILIALFTGFLSRHDKAFERGRALLMASTAVGLFYMHQAFARADLAHLGQSIHPFLLGVIALPFAFRMTNQRLIMAGVTGFLAFITACIWLRSPFMSLMQNQADYDSYPLQGQTLILPKNQIAYLEAVQNFVKQFVRPGQSVLIIPYESGLYPVIGQTSPIWDTYLLWDATETEQELAIKQMEEKNVQWIILNDETVDDREDLRLSVIYDRLWNYIQTHYEPFTAVVLPESHMLLQRKN